MIGLLVAALAVALVSFGFSIFSHAATDVRSVGMVVGLASLSVAVAAAIATWQIHRELAGRTGGTLRMGALSRWRRHGH